MKARSIVIGSGFSGLASSSLLAKQGHEVTLLEKNEGIGGRARQFEAEGFKFDMGPSWYWMPEIFEHFFNHFGRKPEEFFDLKRLDPAFRIFFPDETMDMPGTPEEVYDFFEKLEPGSADALKKFMKEAEFKYEVGVRDIIYRRPDGIKPFMSWRTIKAAFRLQLVQSISKHIDAYFSHPYLKQILEFPVLFLGADPKATPALYSLMDYSGLMQGTWYPIGGFYEIIRAMEKVALENGVDIKTGSEVFKLDFTDGKCVGLDSSLGKFDTDALIISGDYHHFDQHVMPKDYRQYSEKYWSKRTMAPSSLLFYIGHRGKVEGLEHHNLFFDADFAEHSKAIYETEEWPENPLFYVCCPSKTDLTVAPEGDENLFFLIPVAAGINDDQETRDKFFNMLCDRIQNKIGVDIRPNIVYKRDYCVKEFKEDYHAYRGNAYGLANTLRQTAFLKPTMKHKKLKNVFHAGQLTVPGPGVPPSLVSGELAANYVTDYLNEAQ